MSTTPDPTNHDFRVNDSVLVRGVPARITKTNYGGSRYVRVQYDDGVYETVAVSDLAHP